MKSNLEDARGGPILYSTIRNLCFHVLSKVTIYQMKCLIEQNDLTIKTQDPISSPDFMHCWPTATEVGWIISTYRLQSLYSCPFCDLYGDVCWWLGCSFLSDIWLGDIVYIHSWNEGSKRLVSELKAWNAKLLKHLYHAWSGFEAHPKHSVYSKFQHLWQSFKIKNCKWSYFADRILMAAHQSVYVIDASYWYQLLTGR